MLGTLYGGAMSHFQNKSPFITLASCPVMCVRANDKSSWVEVDPPPTPP